MFSAAAGNDLVYSKKRKQLTCRCGAYGFPHRLSGGKCSTARLADKIHNENYGSGVCRSCPCNVEAHYCEVAEGAESARYCQAIQALEHNYEVRLTK